MSKKRKVESNKSSSVGDILSSLQEALSEREIELDIREENLRQDIERFKAERGEKYGNTGPSDVLCLNIAGTKTAVLRRTLTLFPGSMLASKFSGRWDDGLEKDKEGNFFIDQDYSLFKHIIEYLRNKANETEDYTVGVPDLPESITNSMRLTDFYRMVEYYGLTNGMYPTKLIATDESLERLDDRMVNAKIWTTFMLVKDGHDRCIKTYEVTLGSVERVQIGWGFKIELEGIGSYKKRCENGDIKAIGIGEKKSTVALDLTSSSFLNEGVNIPIEGLEHPPGTVVRSEDYGKRWYVNGKRVDVSFTPRCYATQPYHKYSPVLSIKGEFEISFVKLDSYNEY